MSNESTETHSIVRGEGQMNLGLSYPQHPDFQLGALAILHYYITRRYRDTFTICWQTKPR